MADIEQYDVCIVCTALTRIKDVTGAGDNPEASFLLSIFSGKPLNVCWILE